MLLECIAPVSSPNKCFKWSFQFGGPCVDQAFCFVYIFVCLLVFNYIEVALSSRHIWNLKHCLKKERERH